MTEYIFRMGDNPDNMPVVGYTKYEQYPIWGKEVTIEHKGMAAIYLQEKAEGKKSDQEPKKVERDDLQEVNVAPPLGYDTWEEYYRDTTRPERW